MTNQFSDSQEWLNKKINDAVTWLINKMDSEQFTSNIAEYGYVDFAPANPNSVDLKLSTVQHTLRTYIQTRMFECAFIDVAVEHAFHTDYIVRIGYKEALPQKEEYYVLYGSPESYAVHLEVFKATSIFAAKKEAQERLSKIMTDGSEIVYVPETQDRNGEVYAIKPSDLGRKAYNYVLYKLQDDLIIDYRE